MEYRVIHFSGLSRYYLITRYKYDTYSPDTFIPLELLFSPEYSTSTTFVLSDIDPAVFNATSLNQRQSDGQDQGNLS